MRLYNDCSQLKTLTANYNNNKRYRQKTTLTAITGDQSYIDILRNLTLANYYDIDRIRR